MLGHRMDGKENDMGVIKTVDYIGGERYFTLKIEVPTRAKTYHGEGKEIYRTLVRGASEEEFETYVSKLIGELKEIIGE